MGSATDKGAARTAASCAPRSRRPRAGWLIGALASACLATGGCGQDPEERTLAGELELSFETMSFVEEGGGCPGDGLGYWVEARNDFLTEVRTKTRVEQNTGAKGGTGHHAKVRVVGLVHHDGDYGPGFIYSGKLEVIETLSIEQSTGCTWQ